jgi:hypothetical protein
VITTSDEYEIIINILFRSRENKMLVPKSLIFS